MDPSLPKAAHLALVAFCLAVLGALAWAMWLLWVDAQHRSSWFSTSLWGGYLGWVLWSAFRKAAMRRGKAEADLERRRLQDVRTEASNRRDDDR